MSVAPVAVWLFCLFTVSLSSRKQYDGHQLIDAIPKTKAHLTFLNALMLNDHDLDFWEEPRRINDPVTILAPPHRVTSLSNALNFNGIDYNVREHDVQENLDRLWQDMEERSAAANYTFDLNNWNRWSDIMAWMDDLALQCSPSIICGTYILPVKTYEGRYQKVFKMGTGEIGKRAFYVDSTHHAREWLAPATLLNIMDHMARNFDVDSDVRHMVLNYDWYFVPIVNPDGYDYTFTADRYWRKNRTPNSIETCPGTDLNRNYDIRWCTSGAVPNPCSNTYCGQSPLSEVETQNIASEMRRLSSSLTAYVSLHTYSEIWMFPWSNLVNDTGAAPDDCEIAEDHDEMMYVANATAQATMNTHGTVWTVGNACQVLYPMSGTSIDYAKAAAGIKYSQLAELRGTDFVVPIDYIPLSSKEVYNGIVAMVYAIESAPSRNIAVKSQ